MHQIKTVVFDMDGVIVDSEPIHMKIEQEIFQELGLNIEAEEHQQYVGTSAREMWEDVVYNYQLEVPSEKILAKKQRRYLTHLSEADQLNSVPGVKSLIRHLSEIDKNLVLASSSTREEIALVLSKLNLKSYFPVTISGAQLEQSKPDPEIFFEASKRSNTPPEQCCVIEDSQNGVLAAKAAGMKCVGFKNPNSGNQDLSKADIILESFEDQETVVKKLLSFRQ